MPFLNEELPDALDTFKNFQTTLPSTRKLDFCFIFIGFDFSKSETVVGQILQSALKQEGRKSAQLGNISK